MYYINFSLLFQSVDRVTSSQIIQNNIVDTICLYLVMESKINNMLHIIFTLHPVDYLSPHPNHGFKRQHSILLITITSPESRLQKTTLHPVDYLSPHPNHGFKRQHCIPLITYHLTRITASKDNTASRQLPITSSESRLQKTTLHPVNLPLGPRGCHSWPSAEQTSVNWSPINTLYPQQTQSLAQCRAGVVDDGPTSGQHSARVLVFAEVSSLLSVYYNYSYYYYYY